ncbi:hypothetical protein Ciccas_005011 [Cichlidogyrus casuarinus]|uniref:ER lumen protein-retaining receptor n=1 Tax=Cichlidogyrus casuarinus TaxID=1844966 RepID=A0ABD2Q9W3_9PLAT
MFGLQINIFRLLGDFSHILAIFILMRKIWKTRSCSGLSGKTQLLFMIVYISRYLDLFTHFISVYNTIGKIIYLSTTMVTVYLIFMKFRVTYQDHKDSFPIWTLLLPSGILACIESGVTDIIELFWSFSIFLESVAIMPQMFMIAKTKEAETITAHYLCALGLYRAFYIFNWAYRYVNEDYLDYVALIFGIVQTVLYLDFFYLYIKNGNSLSDTSSNVFPISVIYGTKMRLPTKN